MAINYTLVTALLRALVRAIVFKDRGRKRAIAHKSFNNRRDYMKI
ncbi:hypothetical protein [Argonema galeatum]|nr:hypothetical protein [Argonema galeatum]